MTAYPTPPEKEHKLIGSVFERVPCKSPHPVSPPASQISGIHKTGFPAAKRRNPPRGDVSTRSKGQSSFMRSRANAAPPVSSEDPGSSTSQSPVSSKTQESLPPALPSPLTFPPTPLKRPHSPPNKDDWRSAVERENELRVASMSEDEREQERKDILARFGSGVGDVLRKTKEARLRKANAESGSGGSVDVEEVPLTNTSRTERALSLPPSSPLPSALSRPGTRPSSPSPRKLRFVQPTEDDVFVYESAPSSPKRKSILALPPPPTDEAERKDIVSLGDATSVNMAGQPVEHDDPEPSPTDTIVPTEPETGIEEGTPNDIRHRFFPNAPLSHPDLEWMSSATSASPSASPSLRFDLAGHPIPPSASQKLPTHLGLHHHSEGSSAGYTLDDAFLLARSTVPAQRAAMLRILCGVAKTLSLGPGQTTEEIKPLLEEIKEKTPSLLKQTLFVGLEALPERGGVGSRAIELVHICLTIPTADPPLIDALPLDDVLPQLSKVLAEPPDWDPDHQTSVAQRTILEILKRVADRKNAIAEKIVQASGLVQVVFRTFLPASPFDLEEIAGGSPALQALDLILALVQASRTNARTLIGSVALGSVLLRLLITFLPSPGDHTAPLSVHPRAVITAVLKVYIALGRYGMGTSSTSEVWSRIRTLDSSSGVEEGVVVELLETWLVCATDPHATTPPHDLTWSQVQAFSWSEEIISRFSSEREGDGLGWAGALAAWLEGSQVNGVRKGEQEREAVLSILRPLFEDNEGGMLFKRLQDVIASMKSSFGAEPGDKLKAHVRALTGIIRLWLSCFPPDSSGPPETPPFMLPFGDISDLSARLVRHPLWNQCIDFDLLRHLSSLLSFYLRFSRHLPGIGEQLWMAQAFSVLLRLYPGDEFSAKEILDTLIGLVTPHLVQTRDVRITEEVWAKGGACVLTPFLLGLLERSEGERIEEDVEGLDAEKVVIAPLYVSTRTIAAATTQRLLSSSSKSPKPLLSRDWFLAPIDRLLKASSGKGGSGKLEFPSTVDASEVDVVRATLLLANVSQDVSRGIKSPALLERDEVIFGCMKAFMLEHGLDESSQNQEAVFRDTTVSSLMTRLLQPYSYGSSHTMGHSSTTRTLEDIAPSFLGNPGQGGTPFYQFYTDFVALYDSISFSDPLFARLLLPPCSMRYPVDYRKHLWNDFGHIARGLRTDPNEVASQDLREYLHPLERDPEVLGAYLRALVRFGGHSSFGGMWRWIAIHHVSGNIWDRFDESENANVSAGRLLRAVVDQASVDVIRQVVAYRQEHSAELLLPPMCFEGRTTEDRKLRRWKLVEQQPPSVSAKLKKLFEEL